VELFEVGILSVEVVKMQFRCSCGLVLLALIVGCGKSGPEIAPVTGIVTVDGQPMENVDIVFQPEDSGVGSPSYARTGKDGRFTLGYKRGVEGALVGWHRVGISVSREVVRNAPQIKNEQLRREVSRGKNELNFDAKSEAK
jgi:hypothetical protein